MPTLQFITGSTPATAVAQGVVGQIAAINQSIANLNSVYFQYYSTGATTNNSVSFYLNGKLTTVSNVDPTLTLVDYLRYQTPFRGVKQHCRQGGCGVCAVMVSYYDSDSATFRNVSINSCLKLVVQCDGLAIWTAEGIKPAVNQYHPVQERIAKTYGLQCGACTTAQVMSQYTALQPGTFMQRVQQEFLEKNFDGNLCRCSCYPGIIAMARSFLPTGSAYSPAVYNGSTLLGWDLNASGAASASSGADGGWYKNLGALGSTTNNQINPKGFLLYNSSLDKNATSNSAIQTFLQNFTTKAGTYTNTNKGVTYSRVTSLASLISQVQIAGTNNCKIVAAGTSYGVPGYSRPTTNLFLDVNGIPDLHATRVTSTGAVFGANVPINKAVSLMYTGASNDTKFNDIADHLFYISGNHIRNAGSLLGSLVMAKKGGFSSDVAPVMIAAGATLNCTYIYPGYTVDVTGLSITDYFAVPENDKFLLLKSIVIPAKATGEVFWSYRVAQRYFNSHAWLNCAASYTVTANVISNPIVVFGGLNSGYGVAKATTTMTYLTGKDISSAAAGATGAINTIISGAVSAVATDLNTIISAIPEFQGQYGDGKLAFRKNLGATLFYLSFLNLLKNQGYLSQYASVQNALETWISGAADSTRVPELTYQWLNDYQSGVYPVHTNIPRLDAMAIASGEARFNDDVPSQIGQLWAASALSTVAVGSVDWDSSITQASLAAARATPGVEYVVTVSDLVKMLREVNSINVANYVGTSAISAANFTGANRNSAACTFEVFGDKFIAYKGQRIAVVLSQDPEVAKKAASAMVFGYKNTISTYAINVFDGINKEIALNGSVINKTGTYVLQETTVTSALNNINKAGSTRGNSLPWYVYPYTGSAVAYPSNSNNAYELQPGVLSVGATGCNTIPRSETMITFTGPHPLRTYESYYFTGPQGQLLPWSDYIIQSTGAYAGEKMHLYLERQTANCYRDEQGVYQIYSAAQQTAQTMTDINNACGLVKSQINLKIRRIAGGFGGKLANNASAVAIIAVVCCYAADGRMVRFVPELEEDSLINGGESEEWAPYSIGFNASGALNSVNVSRYITVNYGVNPAWVFNSPFSGAAGENQYNTTFHDVSFPYFDSLKNFIPNFQNIPGFWFNTNFVKVPKATRCSYRGPYSGNGSYFYGSMLDDVAGYLGKTFTDVAYINAPEPIWDRSGEIPLNMDRDEVEIMMNRLQAKYDYTGKKAAVDSFNATNKYIKRGIEVYYGRYGSLWNSTSGIWDPVMKITPLGDIIVNANHAEMGQGGDIKIIQLISSKLKCPPGLIRIIENDSNLNWGYGAGATSCGTPNLLKAIDNACNKFLNQYAQFFTRAANGDVLSQNLWNSATAVPYTPLAGTNLSAAMTGNDGVGNPANWKAAIGSISQSYGWVQTGSPTGQYRYPTNVAYSGRTTIVANDLIFQGTNQQLSYPDFTGASGTGTNIYSQWQTMLACMSIVEVNMLTGNIRILETNIIGDCGDSINPQVDQGQMYGGYIFGLGAAFKEERTWDNDMKMLIKDTWDYKIPSIVDIPQVFNLDFYGNTGAYTDSNQRMVMDGKSISELATQSVYASFFAVKSAIRKFRVQQLGDTPDVRVFPLQLPATPDRIQAAAGFTTSMLNVNPL